MFYIKKFFMGYDVVSLELSYKFEIISKYKVKKKKKKSNFITFMTRKQRQNVCQCPKANEHLSRHSNSKSPLQSSFHLTLCPQVQGISSHKVRVFFVCIPLNPGAYNCSRLPFSDHNYSLHYCTLTWSTFDYKQCF